MTKSSFVDKKTNYNSIDAYLRRIFALMFGAVAITAVSAYMTIWGGGLQYLFTSSGYSLLYYILLFGGLGFSIWVQVRAFRLSPVTGALMLMLYAIIIGVTITPLVAFSLSVHPASILYAFVLSAVMFACMAIFGYKTVKKLSFLGVFLMMGMIGLILVGIVSMIWPLGSTFSTIVCLIGVLLFALFTAYDMQTLKYAFNSIADNENQKNQLAVLGALHLYISFIAMFQYLLNLFNRD